jgi:hypothetical protein
MLKNNYQWQIIIQNFIYISMTNIYPIVICQCISLIFFYIKVNKNLSNFTVSIMKKKYQKKNNKIEWKIKIYVANHHSPKTKINKF